MSFVLFVPFWFEKIEWFYPSFGFSYFRVLSRLAESPCVKIEDLVHMLLYNNLLESVGSNKLSLMIPMLWITGKLHLWVSFKRRCDKDIIYPDQTYSYLHTRSQGRWWGTLNPLKELYIALYICKIIEVVKHPYVAPHLPTPKKYLVRQHQQDQITIIFSNMSTLFCRVNTGSGVQPCSERRFLHRWFCNNTTNEEITPYLGHHANAHSDREISRLVSN